MELEQQNPSKNNNLSHLYKAMNEERNTREPVSMPASSNVGQFSFSSHQSQPHVSQQRIAEKETFMTRFLDGIISVSLAALFFGLPLFFTGLTLQGLAFEKEMYFYFWLLLAIVSWVSRGVIVGEMKIRKTPLDIPLVIFAVASIASMVVSVDRWHSFWGSFGDPSRGVLSIVSLIIVYYLVLSHFTVKRMHIMMTSLVASAFVLMVWTLLVVFGVHFLPASIEQHAPLSLMGSITALMIFLAGCLPLFIAVISMIHSSSTRSSFFRVFFTGVLLIGIALDLLLLFLLSVYVSWLAVIIGFAFFLLYILAQVVKIEERWAWLPMLVLVILLAFYMIGSQNILKTTLPIEATPNAQLSWTIVKESLKNKPFFGSGPATYGYNFSLYRPQEYNQQPLSGLRFNQGTGLYFEALSTIGVVGVMAFTILLLSFVSVGLFLLAQKKESNKFLSLGLWSTVMILLISALTGQFSGAIFILGALIASLFLAVLMYESQSEENYIRLSLQSSPKFALAFAFVFLVVSAGVAFTFAFIGKAFWADVLAAQAMESSLGSNDGVTKMTRAMNYMPKESHYVSYLGQIYLTMATQEVNKSEGDRNTDSLKKYVESANGFAKVAHDMSPNDIVIQEALAQTYENTLFIAGVRQDLLDAVQQAYERASALEPHNPVYYVKLGQVKKTAANSATQEDRKTLLSDAVNLFQKSIDEKPNFMLGYFNLALAQEASGAIDDAIKSLAKGIAIDRTSKDVDELKYNLARLLRIRGNDNDLKLAEALLNEVLATNDTSLNAYLTLGLVYEQTDRKDDAIKTYQKVLTLLSGDKSDAARKQIQTFIDNVKAGKSNATKTTAVQPTPQTPPSVATPETPVVNTQPSTITPPNDIQTNTPVTNDGATTPLDKTSSQKKNP